MSPYVSKAQLSGFKTNYKYSCIDDSPLSVYITKPLWIWTSNFIPRNIAPNTLTLTGFFFTILQFLLLSYYDPHFSASTNIPSYIWYVCAIFQYLSYMLDGVDGIQARKTGTSSPLGELMDHGIDSWTCCFTIMSLFSCIGHSNDYSKGVTFTDMFLMTWVLQFLFFSAHWEKLVTGVLYLPWTYDAGICALIFLYTLTGYYGSSAIWSMTVNSSGLTLIEAGKNVFYVGSSLSIIYDIFKVFRIFQNKKNIRPFKQTLTPWVSMCLSFGLLAKWISHNQQFHKNHNIAIVFPRIVLVASGALFANILCRILLYQMSKTKPTHVINPGVMVVLSAYVLDVYFPNLMGTSLMLWYVTTMILVGMHLHFGGSVIRTLSDSFNIYPFSVEKRPSKDK